MTTFLLIRHGETDALGKTIAGRRSDSHLNAAGRAQVLHLAQRLSRIEIRAVYASPLDRALETAEAIAGQHELTPRISEELMEFDFGRWEGMSLETLDEDSDWRRFNQYRSSVRAPGGELMLETQTRMVAHVECLRSRHPGEIVAIVSHADPLRCVLAHYLGISLDLILRFEISPASVSVMEASDWHACIRCINETGELVL